MHSVIGAVIFAAFALGYLLAASGKRQHPEEKANGESEDHAANKKEGVPRWRRHIHGGLAHYKRKRNERRYHRNPTIIWTRRTFWAVVFYTAVTFALFVINLRIANISKQQAEIAQETLVMSQRPWLYIVDDKVTFEKQQQYNY